MPLDAETYRIQRDLAQFCRDGEPVHIPGTDPERLKRYRSLTLNIINESLRGSFPITAALLSQEEWSEMVEAFFATCKLSNPEIWRMPRELYEFVVNNSYAGKLERPYLPALLLLEWVEIEVFMMPDLASPACQKDGCLDKDLIVINPEHSLHFFEYPVFQRAAADLEQHKGHYFLLSYRQPQTAKVHFLEISLFFVRMLELLAVKPSSLTELIEQVGDDLGLIDRQQFLQPSLDFLAVLEQNGMIRGFIRT